MLCRDKYTHGDRDAYLLHCEDGPFGALSVNMPEVHLNPGEVLIKTWEENEEIAAAVLKTGLFRDTGRSVRCGYAIAQVWIYQGEGQKKG